MFVQTCTDLILETLSIDIYRILKFADVYRQVTCCCKIWIFSTYANRTCTLFMDMFTSYMTYT